MHTSLTHPGEHAMKRTTQSSSARLFLAFFLGMSVLAGTAAFAPTAHAGGSYPTGYKSGGTTSASSEPSPAPEVSLFAQVYLVLVALF